MTTEQLGGFEPQEPGRRRYLWAALGVVAVLVAGWSLTVGRPKTPAPEPTPTPSPTRSSSVIASSTNPLQLAEVCEPVTTDDTLQVSFTLVNASDTSADLTYVRPVLPMNGLVPIDTSVALGHCYDPIVSADLAHKVAPGEQVHVRFTLGLPEECPQPYPVAAEITISRDEGDKRYGVAVYPDLGDVPFSSC